MTDKWYDELGENAFLTEEDKQYMKTIEQIKDAVKNSMGFDQACDLVKIDDAELKATIVEDALKVLIAEMHFMQKMPTDKVAEMLKLPVERINSVRETMLKEIEDTAIKAFHEGVE